MKATLSLAVATLLVGCAAAPAVLAPLPSTRVPSAFKDVAATSPDAGPDDHAAWWEDLQQPVLNALVTDALAHNADIEAAVARLQEARALLEANRSTAYPRVDLAAGAARSRASRDDPARNPAAPRTGNRWSADAAVTWEADLFGRRDAETEALGWRTASREARARGVRLAVSADVVSRAFECAALQARIRLAMDALAVDQDLVALTTAKARAGQVSLQDVQRASAQVARSEAALAQLRLSHADTVSALAVLLGATPDDVATKLAGLQLPSTDLQAARPPVSSALLLSRPDVQAAMAELRAASADLAAVAAERFPRIDIAASLGFVAATASGLGTANALAASLAPAVRWRALDFGELDARVQGRRAAERAAATDYKAAVMRAFAEAQTAISQLQRRQDKLAAAQAAAQAQTVVWEVQRARNDAGLTDLASTLEVRRDLNTATDALVQAQLEALAGQVIVNRSLGRGATAAPTRTP